MHATSPPIFLGNNNSIQNSNLNLAASQSVSASTSFTFTNWYGDGLIASFNVHSIPGSASTTLALKIQALNPVSGDFFTIASTNARSATGVSNLQISPFMAAASAGGIQTQVQSLVPKDLRALVSLSTGATSKECVFSLSVHFCVT